VQEIYLRWSKIALQVSENRRPIRRTKVGGQSFHQRALEGAEGLKWGGTGQKGEMPPRRLEDSFVAAN
jgi:hypothetical protein